MGECFLTNAVVVAAGEIVEKESGLAVSIERGGVKTEALGDRIGDDGKPLTKLINKAKNQIAMADGGTANKQTRGEGGFVIFRERCIAFRPVKQRGNLFQTGIETGAENRGMGRYPLLVFAVDRVAAGNGLDLFNGRVTH